MQNLGGKGGGGNKVYAQMENIFYGYSPPEKFTNILQIEWHGVIRAINSVDSLFKRCFLPCRGRFLIAYYH